VASIAKRSDGGWRARYRDGAGREHAKHFARKVDAQLWLDGVTAAVQTGRYVDPRAGRITVEAFAEQWRATLVHRPGYLRIIDNALKNYILPTLGARPLSSLRRSDVQGFVSAMAQERSANSVHNVYRVLAQLMGAAVDDLLVPASPCARVKLPSRPSVEVKPPSPVEVAELAERIPARQRSLVILLAGTGLRISEALGLQVGDVDFLRGTLRVERQRDSRAEGFIPPKTRSSVRTVPLGRVVVDELAAHLAAYGAADDGSIFTDELGQALTYSAWKPLWRSTESGYKTHDLRHYAASALIAGGASVKQVQMILGHASAAVTLGVYAHLWPGDDDRARGILDAALADCVRTKAVGE
jgi:integrase